MWGGGGGTGSTVQRVQVAGVGGQEVSSSSQSGSTSFLLKWFIKFKMAPEYTWNWGFRTAADGGDVMSPAAREPTELLQDVHRETAAKWWGPNSLHCGKRRLQCCWCLVLAQMWIIVLQLVSVGLNENFKPHEWNWVWQYSSLSTRGQSR